MRFIRFILALILPLSVPAAEYAIPSYRLPAAGTWEASGVPGGITHRTSVYATITATGADQSSEIQTALNDAASGQVVICAAGTFRTDAVIAVPSGKTLRGTTNGSGVPTTILDTRATTGVRVGAASFDLNWPTDGANLVVASLTKGATTIQVDDASFFGANHIAIIKLGLDATLPLINTNGGERGRGQVVRIVSVNTGASPNTVTIESPGLHGDYTTNETAKLFGGQGLYTTGAGLEDIRVTGINGSQALQTGIAIESCYASWIRNCTTEYAENYGFAVAQGYPGVYRCEIRHSRSTGRNISATSNSGIFVGACSSVLFVDNIIEEWAYSLLQQGECSGNVWADNFWINTAVDYTITDGNHAPAPQFTLYEGNVGSAWQSDGYYGGSLYDTHFRNWWMGKRLTASGDLFSIVPGRFTRFINIVGNQFGKTGVAAAPPAGFGNPNMSNSLSSNNPSSRRAAESTLTTRTNATSGVITAPSGHGVTTGATIDLVWKVIESTYNVAKVRRGVTVGTVSGTSIPFSGGEGDDLPAQGEPLYVPTSNSSLWDNDPDYSVAERREKWWTGTLTVRTTDTSGVITLDPGQASDFAASWAEAYTGQRELKPAGPGVNSNNASIVVTGIVGDLVTFNNCSWSSLPAITTTLTLAPSNFGFQGLDLDVMLTSILKGNYHGKASGSGIPAVESLSGDTLPSSLYRASKPSNYGTLTWPAINPSSPADTSYEINTSGYRYVNGFDPGGTGATITTVTLNTSTLNIGP